MGQLNAVIVPIVHEVHEIAVDFDKLTGALEKLLGRFDPAVQSLFATDTKAAAKRIEGMEGERGLMLFDSQNHGSLLPFVGQPARKAIRYHVGNPRRRANDTSRHSCRPVCAAHCLCLRGEARASSRRV